MKTPPLEKAWATHAASDFPTQIQVYAAPVFFGIAAAFFAIQSAFMFRLIAIGLLIVGAGISWLTWSTRHDLLARVLWSVDECEIFICGTPGTTYRFLWADVTRVRTYPHPHEATYVAVFDGVNVAISINRFPKSWTALSRWIVVSLPPHKVCFGRSEPPRNFRRPQG